MNITVMKNTLTKADQRELRKLENDHILQMRNFWVKMGHKHGYTNVQIAKEVGLTEGTIRAILKK